VQAVLSGNLYRQTSLDVKTILHGTPDTAIDTIITHNSTGYAFFTYLANIVHVSSFGQLNGLAQRRRKNNSGRPVAWQDGHSQKTCSAGAPSAGAGVGRLAALVTTTMASTSALDQDIL